MRKSGCYNNRHKADGQMLKTKEKELRKGEPFMENKNSRARLGSAALMMMTFSAVFAFPSIINNSIQIGLATIPAYIFGSVFYFLPFILMIAEFASANSEKESGPKPDRCPSMQCRWWLW